jgi:uncharacterized protein YcbX
VTQTVARLGFAPIKGTRHLERREIRLDLGGPVGDRAFCLVDPELGRALRTVQNPALVAVSAQWDGVGLGCTFPGGGVVSGPAQWTDRVIDFDYWGRTASGRVIDGPWAAAFSDYLEREVILVGCEPGQVVFGDALSLITTSSLAALSRSVAAVDPARFRATAVIDDRQPGKEDLADPAESSWIGRELTIGTARIMITAPVARCAVIDIDPVTGERNGGLLRALARTARRDDTYDDPIFGVQAEVITPGTVRAGDPVAIS